MKKNTLILITSNFPFGLSEPYIETEIKYLQEKFDKLILISNDTTSKTCREISREIKVIRFSYHLSFIERLISLKYLFSKNFYEELAVIKSIYKQPVKLIIIKTLLVALQTGYKTTQFIKNVLIKEDIIGTNLFLYSYWFSNMTYGISQFKKQYPNTIAITRAHRWDIYFDENKGNYLPMRKLIINNLNAIFFSSKAGKEYFSSKTGVTGNKLKINRLGTKNSYQPSFTGKHMALEITSCSAVIERKRTDLIIKALFQLDQYDVMWHHIGDGPGLHALKTLAEKLLGNKPNVKYKFLGYLKNEELYEYYKNKPVDIFLNLSSSEGVPMAIVETMSFGIPVIATNVGGVSEIVNNDNGVLLPPNPDVEDIVSAINKMYHLDNRQFSRFRENAFKTWKENYNAEKNYPEFITQVISQMKSGLGK
ncbi:glycosyltransferase [bacterium AH-315-M05]|nr:glycosyltransferase [bacterium AH-315-M05]